MTHLKMHSQDFQKANQRQKNNMMAGVAPERVLKHMLLYHCPAKDLVHGVFGDAVVHCHVGRNHPELHGQRICLRLHTSSGHSNSPTAQNLTSS